MVEFGSGYYMPMDREYGVGPEKRATPGNVSIGEIGVSVGLGPVQNLPALSAKMRAGAKTMELGFMGAGKGSAQGHTPEMYGELQRQALREMQVASEVSFTTHATVGVMGLAGMDQQGNFSKTNKNFAVQEIKRAIDFAADVGRGGTVVVHTGEFQRPIATADWNKDKRFRMYPDEEERATFRVVDERTGGIIQEARKNRKVSRPVWKRYDENDKFWKEKGGKEYVDDHNQKVKPNDYIDYWGNKVNPADRMPRYNKEKGQFEVTQLDWKDLVKESDEMTTRAREEWEKWKEGKLTQKEIQKSPWSRFLSPDYDDINKVKVRPEEAYIISTLETNASNSRGWAIYYGAQFDESVEKVKKLEKALEIYTKIEKATSPEEQWKLRQQIPSDHLLPPETKLPSEIIKLQLDHANRTISQSKEASSAQLSQAEEAMETMRHVQSAETYAKKEAYEAYAEAGLSAMYKSDQLERKGYIKKPLAIAMENLFPESFGAHPDELIDLVENSRRKMEHRLIKEKGLSKEEAQRKAETHITATFDTGHFNMWRKYWVGDEKKTIEDNDKDFNKWALSKVQELANKKIVGHLHIVDNYGYQDEHLAPGQGNTPIKEMIEIFRKAGYKGEMIVEPGADYTTDSSGFQSVMKTWSYLGSGVHGGGWGGEPSKGWGQVQYGYFGQNQPPYFVFGAYSPSEEWTLWSGVPLE